jgi:hypothetical protein
MACQEGNSRGQLKKAFNHGGTNTDKIRLWALGSAQGGPGKDPSGPAIACGNHDVAEVDCRRAAHGQLNPRFQAPRPADDNVQVYQFGEVRLEKHKAYQIIKV